MKGTTMTNANAGRDPAAATTTTTTAAGTKTVYFIRHAESLENLKHQSIQRVMADIKSASFPDTDDVVSVV
eukprot:scaffold27981_cov76-Amphora_coffeaeformis.AAC.1